MITILQRIPSENFEQNRSLISLSQAWEAEGHFWPLQSLIATSKASNCKAWVLEHDTGEPIGAAIVQLVDTLGSLLFTFINKPHRRNGYGKLLLSGMVEDLRDSKTKLDSIELEVSRLNLAAISLYESLGFKSVRVRRSYYKDGSDAVIMILSF